ncbi:uncharacterized protein LOC134181942 [Corticium candelabrum]|uniref:uncharacterized protein LOC134181942 n=1 Tax=Corticium candelabrum TaxID=121492 RepID=UPI002E25AAF2|nr:uncharacterized protein LOC134181942 [Corticium candelabrum]
MAQVTWMGYLSVTSIYGNVDGAWVDETSSVNATSRLAKNRFLAEEQWKKISSDRGVHLSVFRLGAIYDRDPPLHNRVRSGMVQRIDKPGHYFNWIHSDDIVQTVVAAMNHKHDRNVAIYNVIDDEPMPIREVVEYTCDLLGIECPPLVEFEKFKSTASAGMIGFYNESRRVRNDKIKSVLGVKLQYSSFKLYMQQMIKQNPN